MFRKNKTEVLDWRAFFDGEIVTKGDALPPKPTGKKSAIALASAGVATALHSAKAPSEAITAMSPSFEQSISAATKPIKDIIFGRSEEHTSELQSRGHLVCRLLLEKKKNTFRARNRNGLRRELRYKENPNTRRRN